MKMKNIVFKFCMHIGHIWNIIKLAQLLKKVKLQSFQEDLPWNCQISFVHTCYEGVLGCTWQWHFFHKLIYGTLLHWYWVYLTSDWQKWACYLIETKQQRTQSLCPRSKISLKMFNEQANKSQLLSNVINLFELIQ